MTLKQELTSTPGGLKLWQQEKTILAITESIFCEMNARGLTLETLASWVGVSVRRLSKMMDHETGFDIRLASDCLTVMGLQFSIGVEMIPKE